MFVDTDDESGLGNIARRRNPGAMTGGFRRGRGIQYAPGEAPTKTWAPTPFYGPRNGRPRLKAVRDQYNNVIGFEERLNDWDDEESEELGFLSPDGSATTNVFRPTTGTPRFDQVTGLIDRGLQIFAQRRQQPQQFAPAPPTNFIPSPGPVSANFGLNTQQGLFGNISPTTLLLIGGVAFLLLKKK